jgi:hypothetical protein
MMVGSAPVIAAVTMRPRGRGRRAPSFASDQHRRGAIDDAGGIAGGGVVDALHLGYFCSAHGIEPSRLLERNRKRAERLHARARADGFVLLQQRQADAVDHGTMDLAKSAARAAAASGANHGEFVHLLARKIFQRRDRSALMPCG